MIFTAQMARRVQEGRKSQTRRIVKPGETRCRYQPGKTYAIQAGHGRKAHSRLTVLDVRRERLGEITLRDAKAEGFRTSDEFKSYWRELHEDVFDPDQEVWVVVFAKGDHTDKPRLLAARPSAARSDYTDNPARAMRGEMEAIPQRLQDRYAREGEERDKTRLAELTSRARRAVAEIRGYAQDDGSRRHYEGIERQLESLSRKQIAHDRTGGYSADNAA